MSEKVQEKPKQDHEVAADELAAWYAESGIECKISAPRAGVDKNRGGPPWPHVAFTLIFKRGTVSFAQDWRQGIGVGINWKEAAAGKPAPWRTPPWTGVDCDIAMDIAKNFGTGHRNPAGVAYTAEKAASFQGVKPSPAEVLASMAQDCSALVQTFEDWAKDCGYDADSREAERTYNACCEAGRKLQKMLSAANVDRLAGWGSRL